MQVLYTVFSNIRQEETTLPNLNKVESWQEFCAEILSPPEILRDFPKERLPLFGCYHLKNNKRASDQVELVSAIILDYDNKGKDKTNILDFYDFPFECVIYSTYNSTPENLRFRVVVPLAIPVKAADYFYCLAEILEHCSLAGLDPCCKTIAQPYYVPVPGKNYLTHPKTLDGLQAKPFFEWSGEKSDLSVLDKLRPQEIKTTYGSTEFLGRNDKLKSIAWAMLERLELDNAIITELVEADNQHSNPLFTDPSEQYFSKGRSAYQAAEKFLENIKKSFNRVKPMAQVQVDESESSIFEYVEEKYIPKNLLESAPDTIKGLADYFNDRAPVSNPNYAVGAALTLLSVIKGRNFMAQNGVFLNSYIGLVGGSSSGKSVMAEQVSDTLAQAYGNSGEIGNPTSGAAVGRALSLTNSIGWIRWEEFAMSSKSAFGRNAQSYEMSLMTTLMQLFDSPRLKTVPLRTYADPTKNKNIELSYPYLSIIGTSTESDVTSLLTGSNVASGYLPRWLFINGDGLTEKKTSFKAKLTISESLKSFLVKHRKPDYLGKLEPDVIEFDSSASELLFFSEMEGLKKVESDSAEPQVLEALTGKAPVLLTKVAALASAEAINRGAIEWAALVVGENYRYLTYLMEQHGYNCFKAAQERQGEHKIADRVLALLERNKGSELEFEAIRAVLKVRKQTLQQALRYLQGCELVSRVVQARPGTREKVTYILR
jgi:hypothetical protein